ncbi:TlpA family protein disulfide reductase [Aegicerativicinus sediminis]
MKQISYLLLFFCLPIFSQHTISGTIITEKPHAFILVYETTPTGAEYVAQAQLKETGEFSLDIDSTFKPGIYKLVYALPAERHNFNFLVDGKEDIAFTYKDSLGLEFIESNENKLWHAYSRSLDLVHSAINNFYSKRSTDKNAFRQIIKTMEDTQESFEDNSKGLLVNDLIKANRPYIPKDYEDFETYAGNVRNYYLEPINFNSRLILSSDYISQKLAAYVFGMSSDMSDPYLIGQFDKILKKINHLDPETKLSLLYPLWEEFYAYGKDSVARILVDTVMLDLAKESNNDLMIEVFENFKLNGIGAIAPDFKIDDTSNGKNLHTTLHNLSGSDYYLLVFWSSGCSHCMSELPILKERIKEFTNVKVVAFALEDNDFQWKKTIINYPDFIHVLGLNKWENETVTQYSIQSTPSFIVLDKEKKIIEKPNEVNDVITFFREKK